jgi:hypothetical protein
MMTTPEPPFPPAPAMLRINTDAPESTQKAEAALLDALKGDAIDASTRNRPHEIQEQYKTAIHVMIGAKL